MPRAQHAYWTVHATLQGPGGHASGSGVRDWECRYCHGHFSSTITRVIRHVSGIGGKGIAGCLRVPREVADGVIREQAQEFRDVPARRRAIAEADADLLHPVARARPPAASAEIGSTGASTSAARSRKRTMSFVDIDDDVEAVPTPASTSGTPTATAEPAATTSGPPFARQTQLHPPAGLLSRTWLRERQRVAEIEQARFIIDCNISFNVLRTEQWKKMVRATAEVGACERWDGLPYGKMRTTMLSDEKDRIELALQPVRQGWVKYGCTIMSDGWSDQRRRHIINILVSSCLGKYYAFIIS